jgi:hypothetical protein
VRIISTSPLSHVVTELGELNPGSPGPGYYNVWRGRSKKLSSPWIGPYTVVEVSGVNCILRSGTKRRTFKVHSNRL